MDIDGSDGEEMLVLEMFRSQIMDFLLIVLLVLRSGVLRRKSSRRRVRRQYNILSRIPSQIEHLNGLIAFDEQDCIDILRLGRDCFRRLCLVLQERGGLRSTRGVSVAEQVAIFLSVLGHHQKIRVVKQSFHRSDRTVCLHFNRVLDSVMRCHELFLVKTEPVEVDCEDERWKWFKGCLGALDGTYIPICVSSKDHARYRSRKAICSVNVLGVCDRNLNYVYVLTGWEGSAADGRVLRDAIYRPNGFRIPQGNYYLCDAGYTNGEGFLAPYRGVRYHINEWDTGANRPQNAKELFNLRHSKARNCIERSFGILKKRWAILRSMCFYPIETQNKIILACCLLHNFIRKEMVDDPIERLLEPDDIMKDCDDNIHVIDHIQTSPQWTAMRDEMAETMWNQYRHRR